MSKHYYFLLFLCLLCGSATCHAQTTDTAKIVKALTRCWRVISHEVSPIYGLEEEEIKTYSKQNICFMKDSVRLFNNVMMQPRYSIRKVNAEEYAQKNFELGRTQLAMMTDSLFEITISSVTRPNKNGDIFKLTDIVAMDDDFLYAVVDGVIFKLFAADRKVETKGAR